MFLVVVAVEVRQLDRVLDGLDLIAETADVFVTDVGHFLEREVLDFALRKLLQQVAALGVEQEMIAGLEALGAQGLGDDADLFFVGAERDEGALGVELFFEDDDLTLDLVAGGLDDVEAFVEDELLTGLEHLGLERGMQVDLHLAALGEDGDGAVLVGGEIHAVRRGRGTELVDLFLEGRDLLASLVQGRDQDLVLIVRLGEPAIDVTQIAVESTRALRRVRDSSRCLESVSVRTEEHFFRSHRPRPPGVGPLASPALSVRRFNAVFLRLCEAANGMPGDK